MLAAWIDELEPGRRLKRPVATYFSDEAKESAVVDLVTRKESAREIADEIGTERATLYKWKQKLLDEEAPCKMPRKNGNRSIEELEEYAEFLRCFEM